ncbi:hypothetical protein X734_22995 [Mesorhizobium sp. L2C084A000]|nr:hypothetical protein X734_22995 [Mesorhizobium sp. L2C084A000]
MRYSLSLERIGRGLTHELFVPLQSLADAGAFIEMHPDCCRRTGDLNRLQWDVST